MLSVGGMPLAFQIFPDGSLDRSHCRQTATGWGARPKRLPTATGLCRTARKSPERRCVMVEDTSTKPPIIQETEVTSPHGKSKT